MRQLKYVIILLGVLLLLGAAYYFTKDRIGGEDDAVPDTNSIIKVLELDVEEMTEITIENEEGKMVFEKRGEEWEFLYPEGLKADKNKVSVMASTLSNISAEKVVEENASDISQYGLDSPVVVTIKMKDGSEKVIELGDKTFTKDGYYFKEKGSSKVYTIRSYSGDILMDGLNDLRDKSLVALNYEEIDTIFMERDGQLVFKAEKIGEAEWSMVEPIKGNADTDFMHRMVDAMNNTRIVNFIEDDSQNLAQYGLETPHYVLGFKYPEGSSTLLLGESRVKGSEVFAKYEDGNEVFTINDSSFVMLDKPLKEIVSAFAYIVNINKVEKLTIDMDNKRITSDISVLSDEEKGDSEEEKKDQFIVNGVDVTKNVENGEKLFREFYQGVIGITISEVEPDARPAGEPEITFTYYLKEAPGKMVVDFVPKDDRYYYVIRNGEYAGVTVDKKQLDSEDGIRTAWNNLKKAMEKN